MNWQKSLISIFLVYIISVSAAWGQVDYRIQSMFILNFAKYIEWPSSTSIDDFQIGVIGEQSAVDALQKMSAGKVIGGYQVEVSQANSSGDLSNYHLIYIPTVQTKKAGSIINKIDNQPILVVTEKSGWEHKGAHINLVVMDGRMKFIINETTMKKSGFKVSNNLLKLGDVVK